MKANFTTLFARDVVCQRFHLFSLVLNHENMKT